MNERSQRTCNLKYDGDIKNEMKHAGYFTYETVLLLYVIYRVIFRFLKIRNGHFLHLETDFLRCMVLICC
ncbi:hypothetical protein EYW98_01935 [Escherichia coli]|nr:hypothetical protein [Escherichia coli]EGO8375791.1 hypothetical protein [Escherichia coli]